MNYLLIFLLFWGLIGQLHVLKEANRKNNVFSGLTIVNFLKIALKALAWGPFAGNFISKIRKEWGEI